MLSRFLYLFDIHKCQFSYDKQHKKCSKYNLPVATNFYWAMLFKDAKIRKFPRWSALRFVKWHFLSFVFKFFVPNLFLLPVLSF